MSSIFKKSLVFCWLLFTRFLLYFFLFASQLIWYVQYIWGMYRLLHKIYKKTYSTHVFNVLLASAQKLMLRPHWLNALLLCSKAVDREKLCVLCYTQHTLHIQCVFWQLVLQWVHFVLDSSLLIYAKICQQSADGCDFLPRVLLGFPLQAP